MRYVPTFLGLLATGIALSALPAPAAEPVKMTIHADQQGAKISPMLYGLFFEEINRAGDGGIYAEMVQNRSFEDDRGGNNAKPAKALAWTLIERQGAKATMQLDSSKPINPKNPTSLRLEVAAGDSVQSGVANEGFKGIAVRKGGEYLFSMFARCGNGMKGPITVGISDGLGMIASTSIEGVGSEWKKFDAVLTAGDTTASGQLVISVASPGTLWIDQVSLFPKATWKGRPSGLRADLLEMLQAMKPSFIRFPGGCYVEGDRLPNAFRWKDTIGDLAERPGHWNLWGYRSTDGLGYHEYLQMCEDLGAEPLWVFNCGMSHDEQGKQEKAHAAVDVPDLNEYLQDALDSIEYANGPADSKFGALRAKAGHPAPFNLKYVEIGNENGGPTYDKHYKIFYDAIKAKYPEMVCIANTMTKPGPVDINDEHYYSNPEFFLMEGEKYDKYDRKAHKVYVGEYAVTVNAGKGNLRAAIGEAAFMTAMERNSDVVIMASYAPLFVNVGWRQWNPDAIQFDNSRACGTPSYWVQKMFSETRGDVVLPMDFESPVMELAGKEGGIGVGAWLTQAEYKDIQVTSADGKTLYKADLSSMKGFKPRGGQWEVKDGVLRQTANVENCRAIAQGIKAKDYDLTLKARKTGGAEGFLVMFNLENDDHRAWWNIGGWGNARHGLEVPGLPNDSKAGSIETGKWYDIRVEVRGAHVRCFLDGKLIHDVNPTMKALFAVASYAEKSGEVILKVVNADTAAKTVQIDLANLQGKITAATATVLTSANSADENTLDEPNKVVPVARQVPAAAASVRCDFPANSATVLRLKVEK